MRKWDSMERKVALENLEKFQDEARVDRRGLWVHGDIESDDEDVLPVKKTGGRR
jgi:staphylococcal nuclease domain-containing protein 1